MKHHKAIEGDRRVPFWGGLMGYITYEACLETIDIRTDAEQNSPRPHCQSPDLSFVFVERSIVIDHEQQKLYVQSIQPDDSDWVSWTCSHLEAMNVSPAQVSHMPGSFPAHISLPGERLYNSKIRECQKSIREGDAYELCLITQFRIITFGSWFLYLRLRKQNPAPFSAYP